MGSPLRREKPFLSEWAPCTLQSTQQSIVLHLPPNYRSNSHWQWSSFACRVWRQVSDSGQGTLPQRDHQVESIRKTTKKPGSKTPLGNEQKDCHHFSFATGCLMFNKRSQFQRYMNGQSFNWELLKTKILGVDFSRVHFSIHVPWKVVFLGAEESNKWLPATFCRVRKPVIWRQVSSWYTVASAHWQSWRVPSQERWEDPQPWGASPAEAKMLSLKLQLTVQQSPEGGSNISSMLRAAAEINTFLYSHLH